MTRASQLLLLLAFSAGCLVAAGCARGQQSARLPNILVVLVVLVVLVDALRADHLSGYGCDLTDDPGQQRNRYREEDPIVQYLVEVLEELRHGTGRIDAVAPIHLDDQTISELRSLGYVE